MQAMRPPEFLKAVRALSARYVERRAELPGGSPLSSAGKRAAFAGFYAPLHFYTAIGIAEGLRLGAADVPARRILDLGCGTGVTGAACALALERGPRIEGVDQIGWSLVEAAWNWRTLGLSGRTRRADLVSVAERQPRPGSAMPAGTVVVLGWSVNELGPTARARLLRALLSPAFRATARLVIEPISRHVTPWWAEWRDALHPFGGRADEWTIAPKLPLALREIDEAAGFRREGLKAKSLYVPALPSRT